MDIKNPSLPDILNDNASKETSRVPADQNQNSSNNGDESEHSMDYQDFLIPNLRNDPAVADRRINDVKVIEKSLRIVEELKPPETLQITAIKLDQSSEKDGNNDENHWGFQKRIRCLRDIIGSLREDLWREVTLWRREREEFYVFQEHNDMVALEEANAAARAAAQAYAAESPLSEEMGDIIDINPEKTLSELTILEYEKKLAEYQNAVTLVQAKERYNMRRRLAANTYRQKLMEVERLCDKELDRIQQNANSLEPLKIMASQWNSRNDQDENDKIRGDTVHLSGSSPIQLPEIVV